MDSQNQVTNDDIVFSQAAHERMNQLRHFVYEKLLEESTKLVKQRGFDKPGSRKATVTVEDMEKAWAIVKETI